MNDPQPTARLDLEYDGGPFAGWARQRGQRSVRDELEAALATVLRRDDVLLTVAGRTDRGVHARGQVASYTGEPASARSLNALLPPEIAVRSCTAARPGFDARRDAVSRTYRYRVLARRERSPFEAGRALWWPHRVDREALHACAAALAGTHDFTAFTPTDTQHRRFERDVVAARWAEHGDVLEFWIEADAFMRHMNRILVGTMLEVASGRRTLEGFVALLGGRPRSEAGPTAAAHGLCLESVRYPADSPSGPGRPPRLPS
ncbi:MAG: tRNA pseudouridine(38-40) synthase TruA [Solirubrobacteraceae bacterium]